MRKAKRAPTRKSAGILDWTGARAQRVEYGPGETIFGQGDPAASILYLETGVVRLSVLSHAGKEAVAAWLTTRAAWNPVRVPSSPDSR